MRGPPSPRRLFAIFALFAILALLSATSSLDPSYDWKQYSIPGKNAGDRMRFLTKLAAFAVALVAVILIFDLGDRGERRERRDVRRHRDVEVAALNPLIKASEATASASKAVVAIGGVSSGFSGPIDPTHIGEVPGEVRIVTNNGAAFLALRGDDVVAGLSDSIRRIVEVEMAKEMDEHKSGIGGAIQSAVLTGVNKLLDKEISVPVSEIRDIEYRGNRIVISYKNGKPKRILDFDNIKHNNNTLLEQFSEEDARKLVEAVRIKISER